MRKILLILCLFFAANVFAQDDIEKVIEGRKSFYDKVASDIHEAKDVFFHRDLSSSERLFFYESLTRDWRELARYSFDFFDNKSSFKFEESEPVMPQEESYLGDYFLKKESHEIRQKKFKERQDEFVDLSRNQQSKLLLELGKLRSEVIQSGIEIPKDQQYYRDLLTELRLIQYRPLIFLYSKTIDYRDLLSSGISGFIEISTQIFLIFIAIVILFATRTILRKFVNSLSLLQQKLVDASIYSAKKSNLAVILSWLNPYLQWIGLITIFYFAQRIIEETAFKELAVIFPYFIYFFFYRIFRIFCTTYLNKKLYFSGYSSLLEGENYSVKIKNLSRNFGLYFLICAWCLNLSQSIVRKALVYDLIYEFFIIGFVILAFLQANKWSKEIFIYSKKYITIDFTSSSFVKRLSIIFALPVLLVILIIIPVQKLCLILQNQEFVKSIFVHFYRKKLESAAKNTATQDLEGKELPEEYLELFKEENDFDEEEFLNVKSHPYKDILNVINLWNEEKIKENSMIVYGESGIGKTYALNYISAQIEKFEEEEKPQIIEIKITDKITSKEQLSDFLCSSLGIEEGQNLEEAFKNCEEKTVLIIDDCHNLFVARKGGFQAFKYFADLINSSSPNLFFLTCFNRYSWNFLQNALSVSQYFCYQFRLPRWSDSDIKKLILRKHKLSKFELVYDSFIFALNTNNSRKDFEDVEQKFFQMIWGQSRGNPRTAITIWLSSLRKIDDKTLKISLPKITKFSNLINLSDEQFFVYAAISKHQKLSISEIFDVTQMPKGLIMSCIRLGIDADYLEEIPKEGRFRLSASWQILISKVLINKNFIYE